MEGKGNEKVKETNDFPVSARVMDDALLLLFRKKVCGKGGNERGAIFPALRFYSFFFFIFEREREREHAK